MILYPESLINCPTNSDSLSMYGLSFEEDRVNLRALVILPKTHMAGHIIGNYIVSEDPVLFRDLHEQ